MKTVQELITLRELISNICDDLQHYLNDTPVMDVDAADTLEDFDLGEIEKTMEQPIDYNTRKPFRPELMGIYRLAGTEFKYQCIALDDVYYICTMRNIETGWTCDVHDIGIYNNYSIDWSYSTDGHFDKK